LIVRQVNDFSPRLRVSAVKSSSVEIAATQEEPAGLADHLAARIFHLRAAIGTIAGDISRSPGLLIILDACQRFYPILLAHQLAV